ncbi:trimeric intracellular cation channel family protein [Rubritalea spongiae]|uniref:Trimeric intracellular cation channel family protein n=1 Tax=Rubritalea spongiae TaxID=430797 RepID=A0ABW5E1X3_9BACT
MFYIWDIIGTFIFCVSGALAGKQLKMDYLGLFVMALITGTGGGMLRSILLGDLPPVVFTKPDYVIAAALAVPASMMFGNAWQRHNRIVSIVGALGLGVFACLGARTGIEHGLSWWASIGLGIISATFGGVLRDIIRNEVPLIFRKEIYATAALLGAAMVLTMDAAGLPKDFSLIVASVTTAVIRLLAIRYAINASTHD